MTALHRRLLTHRRSYTGGGVALYLDRLLWFNIEICYFINLLKIYANFLEKL